MIGPIPECAECMPEHDHSHELAQVLGLTWDEFVDLFDGGWRVNRGSVAHDFDVDPSGGWGYPSTPWVVAGEPPQLMLRVFDWGVFAAVPRGLWAGHTMTYEAGSQVRLPQPFDLGTATELRRLVTRRRRAIRPCALCWRYVGPEGRFDDRLCFGCETARHGAVF